MEKLRRSKNEKLYDFDLKKYYLKNVNKDYTFSIVDRKLKAEPLEMLLWRRLYYFNSYFYTITLLQLFL